MTLNLQTIFVIGMNHKTASIADRELVHIQLEQLKSVIPKIKRKHQLSELFVLSTCNRFELAIVTENVESHTEKLLKIWIDLDHAVTGTSRFDAIFLAPRSFIYQNGEAIIHLMRVAASLDSVVVGETQITGQFKAYYQMCNELQSIGPILMRLCQESLAVTKKIRTQTDIGRQTTSIAHAAVGLSKRLFRDLSQCRFLIVGAGDMARISAEHAAAYRPKRLTILNRTLSRAQEIATRIPRAEVASLDQLINEIAAADVVIFATSAPGFLLRLDQAKEAMRARRSGNPLFLVDIALPRDIEPACSAIDGVYLFTIDDLKQTVADGLNSRKQSAYMAEQIVQDGKDLFLAWLEGQTVSPSIENWSDHVAHTVYREFTKSVNREMFGSLSDKQREALAGLSAAIVSRLTGDIAKSLKDLPADRAADIAGYLDMLVEKSKQDRSIEDLTLIAKSKGDLI